MQKKKNPVPSIDSTLSVAGDENQIINSRRAAKYYMEYDFDSPQYRYGQALDLWLHSAEYLDYVKGELARIARELEGTDNTKSVGASRQIELLIKKRSFDRDIEELAELTRESSEQLIPLLVEIMLTGRSSDSLIKELKYQILSNISTSLGFFVSLSKGRKGEKRAFGEADAILAVEPSVQLRIDISKLQELSEDLDELITNLLLVIEQYRRDWTQQAILVQIEYLYISGREVGEFLYRGEDMAAKTENENIDVFRTKEVRFQIDNWVEGFCNTHMEISQEAAIKIVSKVRERGWDQTLLKALYGKGFSGGTIQDGTLYILFIPHWDSDPKTGKGRQYTWWLADLELALSNFLTEVVVDEYNFKGKNDRPYYIDNEINKKAIQYIRENSCITEEGRIVVSLAGDKHIEYNMSRNKMDRENRFYSAKKAKEIAKIISSAVKYESTK